MRPEVAGECFPSRTLGSIRQCFASGGVFLSHAAEQYEKMGDGLLMLDPVVNNRPGISGAGGGSRTLTAIWQTDFRTSYDLHRPHDSRFVVWTIPSP
ncbi:MAG: hypothetical protein OXD44_04820 [Gammaproteobacteria bacterium]|nr:hypothetical protein [Gammaproteobacteria bacterium]MCY4313010.1 hypothetical protein [Gammaproteobacteria bacterium]